MGKIKSNAQKHGKTISGISGEEPVSSDEIIGFFWFPAGAWAMVWNAMAWETRQENKRAALAAHQAAEIERKARGDKKGIRSAAKVSRVLSADEAAGGEAFEAAHVHSVYDEIAAHFSSTRRSIWPTVKRFMDSLPVGGIIADVGAGNGKYMTVRKDCCVMGVDHSESLLRLAEPALKESGAAICGGGEMIVGDGMCVPLRAGVFDGVLSIAVIHHMASRERRVAALGECLRLARRNGGRVLLFVWAAEAVADVADRVGSGNGVDTMVPWQMQSRFKKGQENDSKGADEVFERYYHLFEKGELESMMLPAATSAGLPESAVSLVETGLDGANWWADFRVNVDGDN